MLDISTLILAALVAGAFAVIALASLARSHLGEAPEKRPRY